MVPRIVDLAKGRTLRARGGRLKLRVDLRGLKQVQAQLGRTHKEEVPFVTAVALTRTAKAAQSEVVTKAQPSAFTLRSPSKMRRGVLIKPATKRDLEARVFDAKPLAEAQEDTGVKRPRHRMIAIPLRGARPTGKEKIYARNWPKALQAMEKAGGAFRRGNVIFKVLKRRSRGRTGRGGKIVPMYYLVDTWKWRAKYGFKKTATGVANARLVEEFQRAWAQYVKN
jgi:hypothetical protein